jgi:hypothetical protein
VEEGICLLAKKRLCKFLNDYRAWRILPTNYNFHNHRVGLHLQESTNLVSNGHKVVTIYHRDDNNRFMINVSFLQAIFDTIDIKKNKVEDVERSLLIVWSNSRNVKIKTTVICNYIEKNLRYLPHMLILMPKRIVVYLMVDNETDTFKIFVLCFVNYTTT